MLLDSVVFKRKQLYINYLSIYVRRKTFINYLMNIAKIKTVHKWT